MHVHLILDSSKLQLEFVTPSIKSHSSSPKTSSSTSSASGKNPSFGGLRASVAAWGYREGFSDVCQASVQQPQAKSFLAFATPARSLQKASIQHQDACLEGGDAWVIEKSEVLFTKAYAPRFLKTLRFSDLGFRGVGFGVCVFQILEVWVD